MFTQSSIVSWINDPFLLHPSALRSYGTIDDGFCHRFHQKGLANGKLAILLHTIINFARNSLALDGCKSSKATLQLPKPITHQSMMQ